MSEKFDLASYRAENGLTQRDLAKALEVNWKYLSMIETGVKPMSKKLMAKLDQLQPKKDQPLERHAEPVACPQCVAKDKEIGWLKEQVEGLIAALAAKPPPAAGPACGVDSKETHKERKLA